MNLKINEFADFIPAMLVKELRQGLRTKVFTVIFISLQLFLGCILFAATTANNGNSVGSIISSTIFIFFGIILLFLQPLRGISSLSSEIQNNTLDLIALTRLTAFKIIIGKWLSICSQSILLLVSIVPYLTLRYFFGGMNLLLELNLLLLITLASLCLTAFTVCFSACSMFIVRSIFPVITLISIAWTALMASVAIGMAGRSNPFSWLTLDSTEAILGYSAILVGLTYYTWNFLSMGASLIAPAAENHSRPRRLISLILLVLIPSAILLINSLEAFPYVLVASLIISTPILIASLTDNAPLTTTTYPLQPKRGCLNKLASLCFYPTWPSGTFFSIVFGLTTLAFIFLAFFFFKSLPRSSDAEGFCYILALFGFFYFPAIPMSFKKSFTGQRIGLYILIQFISLIMLLILNIMCDALNDSAICMIFCWHPLAYLPMISQYPKYMDYSTAATVLSLLDATILITLAILAHIRHRSMVAELAQSNPHSQTTEPSIP